MGLFLKIDLGSVIPTGEVPRLRVVAASSGVLRLLRARPHGERPNGLDQVTDHLPDHQRARTTALAHLDRVIHLGGDALPGENALH